MIALSMSYSLELTQCTAKSGFLPWGFKRGEVSKNDDKRKDLGTREGSHVGTNDMIKAFVQIVCCYNVRSFDISIKTLTFGRFGQQVTM